MKLHCGQVSWLGKTSAICCNSLCDLKMALISANVSCALEQNVCSFHVGYPSPHTSDSSLYLGRAYIENINVCVAQ